MAVLDAAETTEERLDRHLRESLMIDAATGPMAPSFVASEPAVIDGQSYIDRLVSARLNTISAGIGELRDDFETVLRKVHQYQNLAWADDRVVLVKTVDDIVARLGDGRLGVILWSQTGGMAHDQVWRWSILHAVGLRACGIAYNEANALGYGCVDPEDRGLTSFGQQAVQEMNFLGITVDLTHTGPRTSLDVVEHSSMPVIASHSNAQSRCQIRRNASDELIHKIAERGGVVGVSALSNIVRQGSERPTLGDYLDMIDYMVDLAGIDHIGIGSDVFECNTKTVWEATFNRRYKSPQDAPRKFEAQHVSDFDRLDKWPNVVEGLVSRGYSDEDLQKILGRNWLRVFTETWNPAR